MLRRRAKNDGDPPGEDLPPWLDPRVQNPRTAQAIDHLTRTGDAEPAQGILDGIDHPGDRSFQVEVAAGLLGGDRRPIDRWVETTGHRSALPWVALAEYHITAAWNIRGSGYSPKLSPVEVEGFTGHLRDAEAACWCGHVAEPSSPLPWVPLMTTGRGLGVPIEETIARWDRLDRAGHEISDADAQLLQCLAPKWAGGTDDMMFAFARKLAGDAPAGSARPTLLCWAHLERLEAQPGRHERALYRDHPSVREELAALIGSYFDGAHLGPAHAQVNGLNIATCVAMRFHLYDVAQRGHELLGPRYLDHPWNYVDAARKAIPRSRRASNLNPL